jgi:hypothetical protein
VIVDGEELVNNGRIFNPKVNLERYYKLANKKRKDLLKPEIDSINNNCILQPIHSKIELLTHNYESCS